MFAFAGLEHMVAEYGYGLVFVVLTLEAMGLPLPAESLLIAASIYAATTGRLSIYGIVPAAIAGAIMGDNLGYVIGRRLGLPLLRHYGRYVGLTERRLTLSRWLLDRQGGKVVFAGRFIAVLRTFVALFAGAVSMDWRRFLLWNAVGGVVWATSYSVGAYLLGHVFTVISGWAAIVLGVLGAAAAVFAVIFLRRNEARLEAMAEAEMRRGG